MQYALQLLSAVFNRQYVLYLLISGALTALLLFIAARYTRSERLRDLPLVLSAVLTVLLHYSNLLVNYFQNGGSATIENNHILPVYPCNVVMWVLLVAALLKNKQGIVFRTMAEFCFWAGSLCGIAGIVFNINFAGNPTLSDYYILKGLLSHSTMLYGCLYFKVGKFIKIRPSNAFSVAAGILLFFVCGLGVNRLYERFGMNPPDGMLLLPNRFLPFSPLWLAILIVPLLYGALLLCERIATKKKSTDVPKDTK